MNTVTLTDEGLELVRRQVMDELAGDLRALATELEELALISPWPHFPLCSDIRGTRANMQETLDTLDALGWPEDEREAGDA